MILDRFDRFTGAAAAAVLSAALLATPATVSAQQTMPAPQATPAPTTAAPSTAAPSKPAAHPARRRRIGRNNVEAQITKLHEQLMINDSETAEWNAVADAMRDNAKAMDALVRERNRHRATMNAVDDLKSYEQIADAHAEGLKKLIPAFDALYAKMTPEQQKNADTIFSHRRPARAAKPAKG